LLNCSKENDSAAENVCERRLPNLCHAPNKTIPHNPA